MTSYLYDCLINNIKKNPQKKIIYNLQENLSGSECLKKVKKIIEYLKKNKIKIIGIRSDNSIDWIFWYIASKKICKKVFIFNRNISSFSIKKVVKENKINLIKTNKGITKFNQFKQKKIDEHQDILFTSGTTDDPKGVIIKEKSYLYVAKLLIKKFKQKKSDLELLSMPFDHSFGLVRLRCNIITGSSMLVTDGLKNFPEIYKFSLINKITGISLVPAGVELLKFFLKENKNKFIEQIKYFEIGSSFLNIKTRKWLKKNFKKTTIYHHYGSTEASRSFFTKRGCGDNLSLKQNFIGTNIEGTKIKILKENKKNYGELLIKGKNLFSGYLNHKIKKDKFYENWFKTGDLVKEINYKIILVGRIDNQINIGGNKIYPEIIEKNLEKIPHISNSICVSEIDEFYGTRLSLVIEKSKSSHTSKKIIKRIYNIFSGKPSYLQPKSIIFKKVKTTINGKKNRNIKYF
jgi:acyl-CoA synthetase (AMP-forming)/AMP-acid ligase II